jgi:dipeptidase D
MDLLNLEPKAIWKNFAALNAIPRPSKKKRKLLLSSKILENL